jgi:5-methylcytosine-specific restriction endonuclease McrBC GTP-binding regulatory subunit McrB
MLIAGLLTKPLAILAGVSGTGKSRMVRHLAYKTCLDEDLKPSGESAPGNFKMVQVKPSWHDSADLLGYRSAVNEKHEYVSTDFVKFVLKAHAYPNTPFFVCLDEMNLAPVEHYFAEFLSACESIRKSDVTGEWTSDPIVAATDFDNDVFNLGGDVLFESADAVLDAALKKTRARIEKEGLFIPRNLFVVGTVNMDDSTGGFSRKVLDRAMTIVMNEVHFEDLQKEDKDLTLSDDNLFTTAEIAKFINREDFDKGMLENGFID